MEELYREFKEEEVNKLVEENQIKVKKNNRRKSIRVLIKSKKSIKRRIRTEGSKLDREEKYMLIARMNNIEEAIRNEGQKQFQQKIEKVVDRLKGKNGVNMPSMWEIVKSIERKEKETPTAI